MNKEKNILEILQTSHEELYLKCIHSLLHSFHLQGYQMCSKNLTHTLTNISNVFFAECTNNFSFFKK